MSAIDRQLFFSRARAGIFHGSISQNQVDGIEAILDKWSDYLPDGDLRWLAYILGTAHHETDATFTPLEEYGQGAGRIYAEPDPVTGCRYYGRGFVQLTWRKNYEKASEALGIDLVNYPALACTLGPAAEIIVKGMVEGWFTNARLSQFFNESKEDWYNARRIVNWLDRANLVAGYGKTFYDALTL